MRIRGAFRSTLMGLGLAGLTALGLPGCGGGGPETGDAVVVTPPAADPPTAPAPTPAAPAIEAAPEPAATAPETEAKPEAEAAPETASPTQAEGWGTLKGRVTLTGGDAPAVKVLVERGKASKDSDFCAAEAPIMSERLIVDESTKGIKNALVYIPNPSAVNPDAEKAASSARFEFDQKNCAFDPHVMVVMSGSEVQLKSSDPVTHNVNIRLVNTLGNTLMSAGGTAAVTAGDPERRPGQIVCDIHNWMQAWWMVLDSPYFAVTDAEGNFEIQDVPAGTQRVVVWQEAVQRGGFVTAPGGDDVQIKPGEPTVQDYSIDLATIRP